MTAVIESYTEASSSTGTTLSLTKPSGFQNGDLALLLLGCEHDDSTTKGWSTPTGWTEVLNFGESPSTNKVAAALYAKTIDGTNEPDPQTATYFNSAYEAVGFYLRITGHNSGMSLSTLDATQTFLQEAATTSHVITAATTTVDDCLAISFLTFDGGDFVDFTGFTTGWVDTDPLGGQGTVASGAADNNVSCTFSSKTITSAGTTGTCTIGCSNSDGSVGFIASISPASGTNETVYPFTGPWR
jgi:hypothetical protein